MQEFAKNAHRDILRLMRLRDWPAAEAVCRSLNTQYPTFAAGWLAASRIAMARGLAVHALEAIDRAVAIEPSNPSFLMQRAQTLIAIGRRLDALGAAEAAGQCAPTDAALWDAIGTLRSYAHDQQAALAAYDRAVALDPHHSQFMYNRAAVRRFTGDLVGAEADYDRAIALGPLDYEAYLHRSELRVQTATHNHVKELEDLVARNGADWWGEVQLRFALAKEYEDLGEYAKSFEQLRIGATIRREHMNYDVGSDVATADWIVSAFPRPSAETAANSSSDDPIFIVGLPRSGTTLVDRILGCHSSVVSAGELDCFALTIVDAVRRRSGRAQIPRKELVALSATLDFAELGHEYLRRARMVVGDGRRFIDKMPMNYLYCGLIRRALPHAKIIHVSRHPVALCYAMYKTLFKNAYPFSYDLRDIARYYLAYRRLMSHWDTTMPGVMYQIKYENMVGNQRSETCKLLDYCELDWEEACVAFHENPTACTTASASQVRRPIYTSSVSQWKHYEGQLAELIAQLHAAGIDLGT